MKKLVTFTVSLILITQILAQGYVYNPKNCYYGVNIYQSATGSGYGGSTDVNVNFQKFNRIFEIGVMLNNRTQTFAGIEFIYKHFFGFSSSHFYDKKLKSYFQYNFLYRMPVDVIVDPSLLQATDAKHGDTGGKMTTFEEALGLGGQLKLMKQFYLESSIGFGVYFGSHYQGTTPHSLGIHLNNYGFIPSFKLGLGIQF